MCQQQAVEMQTTVFLEWKFCKGEGKYVFRIPIAVLENPGYPEGNSKGLFQEKSSD